MSAAGGPDDATHSAFANRVDDELKGYLKEVSEAVANAADEEEKELLVENALQEVNGKELKVCTDAECSRMLETLVVAASPKVAVDVLCRLAQRETLFSAATNPFGAHVLEKLLTRVWEAISSGGFEEYDEVLTQIVFLVKEDLYDYMDNKYGTHLARRVLELLTIGLNPSQLTNKRSAQQEGGLQDKLAAVEGAAPGVSTRTIAAENPELGDALFRHVRTLVNNVCGATFDEATLVTLQRSHYASPFLQALCRAAAPDRELSEKLFLKMLFITLTPGESAASGMKRLDVIKLIAQMKNKNSSHFVEAIVAVCPPSLFETLWTALKPHFASLCLNPVANFGAQSVLAAAPETRFVSDIFHTVKGSIHDIVVNKRTGVAVLLLAACAHHHMCTDEVCQSVLKIFGDKAIEGLVTLDMEQDLDAVATARRGKVRLSTNGCIMLRAILSMPQTACRAFTDQLLDLSPEHLAAVARDSSGARAVEALLKGSAPRPLKKKLLLKMKDSLVELCRSPASCRFVEAFFVWSDLEDKEIIAQEIVQHQTELSASKYGAALIQVCQLPAYQRSGDEWRSRMQNSEKLALSYKQLFGAEETSRKKKKKTQKERRDDAASNAQQRGGHASATTEHSSQHTGEGAAVEAVAVAAEAPVEAAAGVEASEPKPKGKKKKKSKGVAPPASEGEDTAAPDAEKLEPSEGKKRKADAAVVLETVELDAKKKKSKKKKAA